MLSDTSVASTDLCQRVYGHVTRHVEQGHCDRGITLCSVFLSTPSLPCKQWFLQAGRYAIKEGRKNHCEQPFAFPNSMRVHVTPTLKRQMTALPQDFPKTRFRFLLTRWSLRCVYFSRLSNGCQTYFHEPFVRANIKQNLLQTEQVDSRLTSLALTQ